MGKIPSKLKSKSRKFQLPLEEENITEGEFQGSINKTLPKKLLDKDHEILSARGSEYAFSEDGNEELPLSEEKEFLELEHETHKHQGLTQHDGLETIYERQESNTAGHKNVTFIHLSCNTTLNAYTADAKVVAPLCGDYPKSQNPIHVLYGTQVKIVAHTTDDVGYEHECSHMDDMGYEDGRVHMNVHVMSPDIQLFSYNIEVDRNEALVK